MKTVDSHNHSSFFKLKNLVHKMARNKFPRVLFLFLCILPVTLNPSFAVTAPESICTKPCKINLEVRNSYFGFPEDEINAAVRSALSCRNQQYDGTLTATKQTPFSLRVYLSRSPPPQMKGYISMTLYYQNNIIETQWATLSPFALAGPKWLADDLRLLAKKIWTNTQLHNCLT